MQLLDLVMLDVGCVKFLSSVLAAAVMYHVSTERIALFISGIIVFVGVFLDKCDKSGNTILYKNAEIHICNSNL